MFLAQIWFVDHQFMKHRVYERPCHWTLTSEEGSTASERLVTLPVVTQLGGTELDLEPTFLAS